MIGTPRGTAQGVAAWEHTFLSRDWGFRVSSSIERTVSEFFQIGKGNPLHLDSIKTR